jgi:hypothetical protein
VSALVLTDEALAHNASIAQLKLTNNLQPAPVQPWQARLLVWRQAPVLNAFVERSNLANPGSRGLFSKRPELFSASADALHRNSTGCSRAVG